LFEVENGRLLARLSRFQVLNGYKLAGEEIDPEGLAALEALESKRVAEEYRRSGSDA
jgi:hypothetical protein